MFRTIVHFTDMQDEDRPYYEGDPYPREGLEVSEERFKELSTSANRRGIPLIEKVQEEVPEEKPAVQKGRKAKHD
ncbi:MAG: hypothetical protein IJT16_07980 [Lachnospiraceae bacterium]|nr:hypothetical protein [Lachnospiraceae bacterium]